MPQSSFSPLPSSSLSLTRTNSTGSPPPSSPPILSSLLLAPLAALHAAETPSERDARMAGGARRDSGCSSIGGRRRCWAASWNGTRIEPALETVWASGSNTTVKIPVEDYARAAASSIRWSSTPMPGPSRQGGWSEIRRHNSQASRWICHVSIQSQLLQSRGSHSVQARRDERAGRGLPEARRAAWILLLPSAGLASSGRRRLQEHFQRRRSGGRPLGQSAGWQLRRLPGPDCRPSSARNPLQLRTSPCCGGTRRLE